MNGFALILGFGCVLGLWNMARRPAGQHVPAALLMMGLALLGARAAYVLLRLPFYIQQPWELVHFSAGGLDGPGAMLGALLGLALAGFNRPAAFLRLLEDAARVLVPVVVAAWLGCWLNGAAQGAPSLPASLAWLDWAPAPAAHWPLPALAAVGLMGFYFWLDGRLLGLKDKGRGFVYFLAAAVSLLLVSLLRQDQPAPYWNGMRLDILESTLLSLVCLAASLVVWIKFERKV